MESESTGSREEYKYTIDAKAKVKQDTEKQEHFEQVEEEYFEEREKKEEENTQKLEAVEHVKTTEKKHRDTFLKKSFLETPRDTKTKTKVFGGVEEIAKAEKLD